MRGAGQTRRGYVAAVDALLEELHLVRANKDRALGQKGTFLGTIIDSHWGRLNLTKEKPDKLLTYLLAVLTWDEATPRMASRVRGKLQSYSECIEGVKPFSVPFTVFIGPAKTVAEYDAPSRNAEGMKEAALYLLKFVGVPSGGSAGWGTVVEDGSVYVGGACGKGCGCGHGVLDGKCPIGKCPEV